MIVIGAFEQSLELDLLLASLENNSIARKYIIVVPMDIDPKNPFQLNNKKRDICYKGIEVGMAFATGCSVIGASMGFILAWGPIIWGLLDAGIGFVFGFGIYLLKNKYTRYRHLPNRLPEVAVIVQCQGEQTKLTIDMMWKHCALSVGKYGAGNQT
jgi:hypothetical protein